jgi:hypothetical protein
MIADDNPHFEGCDQFLLSDEGRSVTPYFRLDSTAENFSQMDGSSPSS